MTNTAATIDSLRAALRAAIAKAQKAWTGLDWDSSLAPVAGLIRAGKRVDIDEVFTAIPRSADSAHHGALRALKARIEDHIDDEVADDVREEVAAEAERLAEEEAAWVAGEAAQAARLGQSACDWACNSNDPLQAVLLLKEACAIQRNAAGSDRVWSKPLDIAEDLLAQAVKRDEDDEDDEEEENA